MGDELAWIQEWYHRHCNGEWERQYGVKVDTLDNPGWSLTVDLRGTEAAGRVFDYLLVDHGEEDWYSIQSDGRTFEGNGDPRKLTKLMQCFREWVEQEWPTS